MKTGLNTPDGRKLITRKQYLKEWQSLGDALIKALGNDLLMIGFDPSITLATFKLENGKKMLEVSTEIPVWLAKRIIENSVDN